VTGVPNVGRSYYQLLQLMPGVNSSTGNANANGANVGVNGYGRSQYNWQIDGAVAMLPINQNPDLMRPPLDSISEVTFTTANFGAEYGNGLAVFKAGLASGTGSGVVCARAARAKISRLPQASILLLIGLPAPGEWFNVDDYIGNPIEFLADQEPRSGGKVVRFLNRHFRVDFNMKFNVVFQAGLSRVGLLHTGYPRHAKGNPSNVLNSLGGGHRVHEFLAGIANDMKCGKQYNQAHEHTAVVIGGGKMLRVVEGQRKRNKSDEP
jgi:hypothetical protein